MTGTGYREKQFLWASYKSRFTSQSLENILQLLLEWLVYVIINQAHDGGKIRLLYRRKGPFVFILADPLFATSACLRSHGDAISMLFVSAISIPGAEPARALFRCISTPLLL